MLWNQYLNVILKWCFLFVWDILFSQPQLTSVAHVASLTSLNNSEPCHPEVCGSCLGATVYTFTSEGVKKSLTRDYRQANDFSLFFLDLSFVINYFCSYVWALLLFWPLSRFLLVWSEMKIFIWFKIESLYTFESSMIASHVLSLEPWKIILLNESQMMSIGISNVHTFYFQQDLN